MEANHSKSENQQHLISELTSENEQLFQQFNHLMIRNTKLLKRIDDLQQIINDLHLRVEELNHVNGNLLRINDHVRGGYDNRNTAVSLLSTGNALPGTKDELGGLDLENLYEKWKAYPGQQAKNEPNLRKQVLMLAYLYNIKALNAADLFYKSGIGGVTGARYVATLKKCGLIQYTGARKKGSYVITQEGKNFIEKEFTAPAKSKIEEHFTAGTLSKGIPLNESVNSPVSSELDHFDL